MNFFEHQDKARRKTKVLVLYFLLAIITIVGGINALVYGTAYYITVKDYHYQYILDVPYWLYITPVILSVILLGTLFKMIALRGGGKAVAKMVNAQPIYPSTQNFKEKRLINVVEEMSIASGVPMPKLYLLPNEPAINAFVAGIKPNDTVLVVTQGALDTFNRAELQAVIGHEYSHIFNSDMRINLKLIGLLAGITAVSQLGYFILRTQTGTNKKGGGGLFAAFGIAAMLIGYIGVFFARIIKAAISRQRELLADACSVQYTRYPQGLVSAFKKMILHTSGSKLESTQAEDISHLCFGDAMGIHFFGGLLATHPSLDKRIKAIDPNNQYEILPETGEMPDPAEKPQPKEKNALEGFIAPMAILAATGADAKIRTSKQEVKESIGNPSLAHLHYAAKLHKNLPEELMTLLHSPDEIGLVYFMLMLARFPEDATLKEKLIEKVERPKLEKIKPIYNQIKKLPFDALITIFDLSLPAFLENDIKNRQAIYNAFEDVVQHVSPSPFRFALLTILGRKLVEEKNISDKPAYTQVDPLLDEVSQLFALILFFSHKQEHKPQMEEIYHKVLLTLTPSTKPLPTVSDFKPIQFRNILERLNGLTPELKSKLISACIDLVLLDDEILAEEAELLRVISECLETPMPPIIQQAKELENA